MLLGGMGIRHDRYENFGIDVPFFTAFSTLELLAQYGSR